MRNLTERHLFSLWLAAVLLLGSLSGAVMLWPKPAACSLCPSSRCAGTYQCTFPGCVCMIQPGQQLGTCVSFQRSASEEK